MKKKRLLALVAVTVLFSLVYLMGIESIQSNASTPPSRGKNSKILREDTSRRREFEKHFELVDGMYMAVSYSEPYGIMMRYSNESINDYNAFYSADYSVESMRPQLTTVYNTGPTPPHAHANTKWLYSMAFERTP
jgi:hypothetical protein